jgi:hypothetical protein
MLQRYKLRLSDGTLLVVDHDALSSWVVDGKAMVQPVGSDRWCSLKKFLLEERATGSPWWSSKPSGGEIPGVHRTLLDDDGAFPPVRPPRELPLIPPPSRRVPADEIVAPPPESSPSDAMLEAEPPAPAVPLPSEPEMSGENEVSLASAQLEPLPAMTEPPSIWVSEEPVATESFSPPATVEEDPITLSEPLEDEGTPGSSAAPAPGAVIEPPEPPSTEVLNLHALAEEAAAPSDGSLGRPAWRQDNHPVISLEPLGEEGAPQPTAARRRRAPWDAPPPRVAHVQVLAEDTVAPPVGSTPSESTPGVKSPVIALKPLDDNLPTHAAAPLETDEDERAERTTRVEAGFLGLGPPWGPRVNRWLDHLSRLLDHLGRWLDDFTSRNRLSSRWARLLASGQRLARLPVVTRAAHVRPPSDTELPIIPLRLLDDEGPAHSRAPARAPFGLADATGKAVSMVTVLFDRLRRAAPGWNDHLRRWTLRLSRPKPLLRRPPADEGAMPDPFGQALRTPLMPPPNLSELPVLRLAKIDEKEMEPVYDDIYEGPGFFDVAWLWAKRVTLLAGLVAGGIIAANTWEIWLPRTAQLARMMFLEIDERVRPAAPNRAEEPSEPIRAALQAANEQLPHLAPETIELVMSRSLAGVLDPPEVFGRAHDAMERGMGALTAEEARELRALRLAMLARLHPAERERLHEYDLERDRRVTLPFEDREALGLVARGTRALPPEARERFQWLAGKAVTAGLSVPDNSAPRAATAP